MKQNNPSFDPEILIQLTRMRMTFGRYKDRVLCDLPEPYLVWFHRKGYPSGKIGILLESLYEIRINGLDYLLTPFKEKAGNSNHTNTSDDKSG
ncbi:MAG TPA: DUF3820 family protein [Dehalococcoidia bacterium]|nr:DUF3820 family protein [Dehalococcoidia bacterium]